MPSVLHIQGSPRGDDSFSIRAAEAFLAAYGEANSDATIETLELASANLPPFHGTAANAKIRTLQDQALTYEQQETWDRVCRVIRHFKGFDRYVISAPMWNFSVSYLLKHYIDLIVQPGELFTYTGPGEVEGFMRGRPMMLVLARGGRYGEGSPSEGLDYQLPYLEAILGFVGFDDIQHILVEPTASGGPEAANGALEAAKDEARRRGAEW